MITLSFHLLSIIVGFFIGLIVVSLATFALFYDNKDMADGEWCYRRDMAEQKLLEARRYIYPELHGIGHSYGVGKFEVADTAWNVYQVLRHALGDERKPYAFFGQELPLCSVTTSGSTIVDDSEIQHVSYNDEQLGRNK